MASLTSTLRRTAVLAFAAFAVSTPAPADAQLGAACPGQSVSQVFLPWADPAWYTSVPDGGLEAGGAGWTLSGAAAVVEGNEPFHVRSASDSRALALAPGASASSPPACVGPGHPTLRFFARSERASGTWLIVAAEFVDPVGVRRSVPVGMIAATPSWQPTPVLPIVVNALALTGSRPVGLRFTRSGGGDWFVDDVYVDPYGKG
jgi:hypothetical protein